MSMGCVCTVPYAACTLPEDASCNEVQSDAYEYLEESGGHGSGLMKGLAMLGTAGSHPNHVERDLFRQLHSLGLKLPLVRFSDPKCQLPRLQMAGQCIRSCWLRRSCRPRRPCRPRRSCRPRRPAGCTGFRVATFAQLLVSASPSPSVCSKFRPFPQDLQLRNHTG
jgi:hypothetical protein